MAMNIMRKMMGSGRSPLEGGQQHVQDNNLGLMHLRKLFSEFRSPPPGASQKDLKDKLFNMLPLFCKVFSTAPSSDMTEKFPDVLQFCGHVSRLMVSEIRKRASDQSTESASYAIVKFLEIESTEVSSNGWMLLSSINLLSTGVSSLIDCMTAACLPSTLVKCLYLFFDLPDVHLPDLLEPGCEFTARERRVLLQKVFVQVLVRLCSHVSPAEELARKDDLALLFSAITSWCPVHNIPWRKSAAEVLMTLSRHGLTPNVVQYIHNKGCVGMCTDNMQRVQELSPIELVEMFVTVFCFLKDSSEVSQLLLDDFRTCQGYLFLSDFLLRMEKNESEEAIQALRNLVLLVGSLTTCGYIELKPSAASSGNLFKIPGFNIPQPAGKGVSVRNIQAFQVLQTVFLKGTSTNMCSTILDVLSSIYHQDNANYFILEAQNTLSQFAEKIHLKNNEIQLKFFEILEFLVFNLNFVPCKEFISLSILIKTNHSLDCSILCIKTLVKILHHHMVYKDVFREVGLLEVMVTCLHRYAALLKEIQSDGTGDVPMTLKEQEIGFLVMDALCLLLNNNNNNASVFRECGGARCAHNMVPYMECRQQALNIVQQLVLSNGGEDDMGTLLGLMHTAPTTALQLKTHVLRSLLHVLKESHRTRTVFRKVGGFVYVMSVLVSMEGCLADPPKAPWNTAERREIILLLKTVFSTLTVAMRYEPANARVFATEVRYASLTEAVRLLGCFSDETHIQPICPSLKAREDTEFADLFCNMHKDMNPPPAIPPPLISACMMLRYLYDMALDNFDRPSPQQSQTPGSNSPNLKRISSVLESASDNKDLIPIGQTQKRASTGSLSLNLNQTQSEPLLVHAGAVISMLHLVPGVCSYGRPQLALDLQTHTCEVIRALVRTERNQQVMCEAGLPHELLAHCSLSLTDEEHILHTPLQYMFERLAAQCLTPKDLRDFLRLGYPLCCATEDEELYDFQHSGESLFPGPTYANDKPSSERRSQYDSINELKTNGGAVPLTRVKCLVSMTTPRDVRLHGASITPAFVEFDMSAEGFGCLYLPSIAPQGPPTPSVVGAGMIGGSDPAVVGGIGTGERVFPPQSGLTFASWVCIDKFSCPSVDPHPVRLLTIERNIQGREENIICLNVFLAPRDRALFVSTHETHMPTSGDISHEPAQTDTTVRFWCPELTQEGQWRHLVLIFHKAGIMKNSSVSLFIDGGHVDTQKLHYISPNLGGTGTTSLNAATTVFTYISSPPQLRRRSRLLWRQGPCHLFEDIISTGTVQILYQLGPNYIGSFQAPMLDAGDSPSVIISEDKVIFGIHAHAMSLMTVARIRKVYNKTDAKSIAKQLGMSAHENATPIRILHNAGGHLSGAARSFGAVLIGYLGVRTFCPKPVAKMIMNVGGTSALLGLIAMATDVEGIYAAVKALVCVVRSNKEASREMDHTKGYQTLAILFKKKPHLLNSHILHLTFSLVGTLDSRRDTTIIPNKTAFVDLICELEVWQEAPSDLQRSLYEHFYELLTESSDQKNILHLMQEIGLVNKLLYILRDTTLTRLTAQTIMSVLSVLLCGTSHAPSLLRFGQFMCSLLSGTNEKSIIVESVPEFIGGKRPTPTEGDVFDSSGSPIVYNIKLRNLCLEMLIRLLTMSPTTNGVNVTFSEELQKILGFDWLMLFMRAGVHSTTVITSLRVLLLMLQNPGTLHKFRDGIHGGGWLADTESVLKNRIGVLLGFNVGSGSQKNPRCDINHDICHLPGFVMLQWLMLHHADVPQLYLLLMSLLLGQQIKQLPKDVQFNLDTVWTVIFGVPEAKPVVKGRNNKLVLCGEAAGVILAMVRTLLNQPWESEPDTSYIREYPVTPMQFILYLYHNQPNVVPICMTSDFLASLSATLFPQRSSSEANSEITTPLEDFKPFPGSDAVVLVKTENRNPPNATTLSTHPACKFVMDFLRVIIVDSLSLSQSSKSAPVIDMILEVSPEMSTRHQRQEFQTQVLNTLMDHLLAADVLLGEQAALPVATGGSYTHMANNVFYLAGRVVDKLWQGAYVRDPKEVFEFITKLISQAKRKASGVSLDNIYKCLNRTILYQLSRPMHTMVDHTNILDALHKLTECRNLVFGPGNFDQEFFGCLCYCLLQLTDDPRNICDPPGLRTTTWHIDPSTVSDPDTDERFIDPVHSAEGLLLLATAARRVWDELYICKKPAIEEIFKVTLLPMEMGPSAKYSVPDLCAVRPQIQDISGKMWLTYFDNERRCVYSNTERLHSQLQSKLQKVGHGVLRLAQRKSKKENPVKAVLMTSQECLLWTTNHLNIVRDLVEFQYKQHQQGQSHMESYLMEDWRVIEAELMRERGLWGPPVGSELDKWTLDLTEGPHRTRKKMILNDRFYINYPYIPPSDDSKPTKYKMAISIDSQKYYERYRSRSLVAEELFPKQLEITEEALNADQNDNAFEDLATNTPSLLPKLTKVRTNHSVSTENDEDPDLDIALSTEGTTEGEGQTEVDDKTGNQIILKLLEEGEKISHMFRCARIQGLDTMEGLLLFGKEHFYIVDGFTLLRSKEIADIDNLPPDMHDPIIPKTAKGTSMRKACSKFSYEEIREVHKRRYLLQPIAVEVFSTDGRNLLLACPRKVRNKVYARFMTLATAITDSAHESVSGQKQNAKVEPGTGLISSLIGEKSVTQRWERGEISNFEYLMCLNTLAGRSYNDLMQYPVFPWILADYFAEELDLTDPDTFRDLSKPMGAQTPNRLKQFKKRYSDWDDPQGETPPYHYGTHYSSAMIVASYLIRMEPFTQIFLRLQGGHFDLADRMFHSVGDGWLSASKHNMADVKELIPEFFYLPEFLLNSNNFDLGTKQSGVSLGDVVLPTWAKGDAREFIRVHREALECDFVSAHLNEWIDLIFGHKQQGPAAVEAVNAFHHLFYEGNVDIYNIDDPLKKNATIGFINNFGQIPKQLFRKPHPQKKLSMPRTLDPLPLGSMFTTQPDKQLFFHHLDNLKPTMTPIKELKSVVGHIIHNDKTILAVEQNKVLIPPSYNKYLAWGFSDLSLRIGNYDSDKATNVFENVGSGEILSAACPDAKTVVTAGTSTVVYVWEFGKRKDKRNLILRRSLYGHTEPVTCLAASAGYNIIVSGSRDRTCVIWDLSRLMFVRQLRGHAAPVAAVCINELAGEIATCAGTYLHVWSINGDEIASINTATGRNQQIFCVAMSQMMEWDARNVIMTGSSDGVVRMWSLEFVEVAEEPKGRLTANSSTDATDGKVSSDTASVTSTTSQPQNVPGSRKRSIIEDPPQERSAADRLLDFKDPEFLATKTEELGSSAESDSGAAVEVMRQRVESLLGQTDSDRYSDTNLVTGNDPGQCNGNTSSNLLSFNDSGSVVIDSTDGSNTSKMPLPDVCSSHKSPRSPTDFVMVTETDVKDALSTALQTPQPISNKVITLAASGKLRDGFRWQRQLVFKSKLTMHTAFERKDNKDPAAVTAVAVSKDHRTVYVGDAKGRVYSWTVTDQPGRAVADHWVKDEGGDNCQGCNVKFSFSERRHHCRNCGQLFCSRCSRFETDIKRLRILKPVRVCQTCYNSLKAAQASEALTKQLNARA